MGRHSRNVVTNPWHILRDFAKENPKAGAILYAGVASFAAVAAVGLLGGNLESRIPAVIYIIGIGLLLLVIAKMIDDHLIMLVLKWFIVVLGMIWILVFAAHRAIPKSQVMACLAIVWQECRSTADSIASADSPPPPKPANIPQVPAVAKYNPRDYTVLFQFAGSLERDSVRAVMRELRDRGWNVQGVEGGGERKREAAGTAEVRYLNANDKTAASGLASAVQATNLIAKPIKAVHSSVNPGTLEVWISR